MDYLKQLYKEISQKFTKAPEEKTREDCGCKFEEEEYCCQVAYIMKLTKSQHFDDKLYKVIENN